MKRSPSGTPRLAAFHSRDFRLLWSGQLVSTIGSQMQIIAVNWQVYRQLGRSEYHLSLLGTHLTLNAQALGLGLLGAVRVVPLVLFVLIGGVLADTHDRRRLILIAQTAASLFAALLAGITLSGHAGVGQLYALTAADTATGAFEGPAMEALVPRLVPPEHVTNAASLNALIWAIGTIAGPALAGIAVSTVPIGIVYAANAVSFLIVALAVARIRHREAPHPGGTRPGVRALVEGIRFTRGVPLIWSAMLLDFWATFFSSARTMLPIVADRLLGVGVQGYGILATAQPIGAVLAGAALSLRRRLVHQGTVLLVGVAVYAAATALFGISRIFVLSYILFFATGAGDTLSTVVRASMRQLLTPNALRGRLSSVHLMLAMGGPQLGELEAGLVAAIFGVSLAIVSGGMLTLGIAAWVAWRYPALRRYRVGGE